MEQSIKNMELIVFNVKKELMNKNYSSGKTLMNTYRALLKRFLYLKSSDERIDKYRITLDNQKTQLQNLHNEVEKEVESTIISGNYKGADTLVEVSWRLDRASSDIASLIWHRENFVKKNNRDLLYNIQRQKRQDH